MMDRSKWYEDMTYAEDREAMDKVIDQILEYAAMLMEEQCSKSSHAHTYKFCRCIDAETIRDGITPPFSEEKTNEV